MFKRQEPINASKRNKFHSYLGANTNWWDYYSQYKNVVDDIVNSIEKNTSVNSVCLPLLFLIRHSLEIGLKANILKFEKLNPEIEKIKLSGSKSHSLEHLLEKFTEHIRTVRQKFEISDSLTETIEKYLTEFHELKTLLQKLDANSCAFRYPVDNKKNLKFSWDTSLNVADVIDKYYSLQPFLVFCDIVYYEQGVPIT